MSSSFGVSVTVVPPGTLTGKYPNHTVNDPAYINANQPASAAQRPAQPAPGNLYGSPSADFSPN